MSIIDGEFAFTKGVPEADGSISGARDDLSVVSGEGNRGDVFGVTNELTVGFSFIQVPETDGVIPGSGKSEMTIFGDDNIFDVVGVSSEGTTGRSIFRVGSTFTFTSGDRPANDGFVSGSRQDHFIVFIRSSDGSNPSTVTFQDTSKGKFA